MRAGEWDNRVDISDSLSILSAELSDFTSDETGAGAGPDADVGGCGQAPMDSDSDSDSDSEPIDGPIAGGSRRSERQRMIAAQFATAGGGSGLPSKGGPAMASHRRIRAGAGSADACHDDATDFRDEIRDILSRRPSRALAPAPVTRHTDSKGTAMCEYRPGCTRPDFAHFFVWRGTEWIWSSEQVCAALTRWVFDPSVQGIAVQMGGAIGQPAMIGDGDAGDCGAQGAAHCSVSAGSSRLAMQSLHDLRCAESISDSELATCRAVYDTRTMEFRTGVINRAGQRVLNMDDDVRALEEDGIISTPSDLPDHAALASAMFIRALLMREETVVFPGSCIRYCFASE